jgi:16S rRNA (cytosine967-C5)-methyltransferase
LLRLGKGLSVLDACAAPGGKTCHLLETEPGIELTAIDRDVKRMKLIEENLDRLGLTCEVLTGSLEDYQPGKGFDRVLLDAPCSATGIIRRHPDIKLLRKKSDVDKLSNIQRVLLDKAFDLLKHGGELLYSTCSILVQENDHIVSNLLASNPDAELLSIDTIPEGIAAHYTETGLQLFPTPDSHDGFFYARIGKRQVMSS